jgi:hypothetical protein
MPNTIFVIYGRDSEAYQELGKFIKSLGLVELKFDDVAAALDASAFIADIVRHAITKADAVIALFTPDELAALYSPDSGRFIDEEFSSRWQARPNVIFEAGVAFGIAPKKTILVTLGADVTLFSDVHGIHFIQLDQPNSKAKLRNSLSTMVEVHPRDDWENPVYSGDFSGRLRRRWDHYDELEELEKSLNDIKVGRQRRSLLYILRAVVRKNPAASFASWTSAQLMSEVQRTFNRQTTDETYWWLVVLGVLRFLNIDEWYEDEDLWENSVAKSMLSRRGVMLLGKFQVLARIRVPRRLGRVPRNAA